MATESDRVRFPDSIDPVTTDGRDVDTTVAMLEGEAAQQQAFGGDRHVRELSPGPWDRVPAITETDTTYYGRPMLKQSVWSIDIPIYYFLGGAAGAALTLGAAIQLVSPKRHQELRRLSAVCHWIGIVGSTAGAGFLIHDLGRPSRFLYMMRVFRPTSPMNVGAWILGGAAPSAIATGLLLNRPGLPGAIGEAAGYTSGIFGAALAGYTGVLVSNSAIPIWQQARRWMPVLFTASGAAAAGSIIDVFYDGRRDRGVGRIFATTARIAEIAATFMVERTSSTVPAVGEPLHRGVTALLWNGATVMTGVSLALSLLPGRSSRRRIAAGLLGALGSLCMRFAVHYVGKASARNPRASFQQQAATRRRKPEISS